MPFPFIPFVAGAVVGDLVTYLIKNDKARQLIHKKTVGDQTKAMADMRGDRHDLPVTAGDNSGDVVDDSGAAGI